MLVPKRQQPVEYSQTVGQRACYHVKFCASLSQQSALLMVIYCAHQTLTGICYSSMCKWSLVLCSIDENVIGLLLSAGCACYVQEPVNKGYRIVLRSLQNII